MRGISKEFAMSEKSDSRGREVTLDGTTYPSLAEACRQLGVIYHTVYQRRQKGMSLEEAMAKGRGSVGGGVAVVVDGVTYPSKVAAYKALGVNPHTAYKRQAKGMSFEESVMDNNTQRGSKGKPITVYGVDYPSKSAAARAIGIPIITVNTRLARGLGVDEAFLPGNKPVPAPPDSRELADESLRYRDLQDACWQHSVNYHEAYVALKGGTSWPDFLEAQAIRLAERRAERTTPPKAQVANLFAGLGDE